jgi:rubrerythrin
MQALYEAILEDEAVLAEAFKYELLTRQAEASGDQDLIAFFRQMRDENRRRAERAERLLAQRLPEKKVLRKN